MSARRAAALLVVALAAALLAPSAAPAQTAPDTLGVFVVVVDGLLPEEINATTPNLAALQAGATWYEESRSVMIAETIPNHVAMMTGVYPERSSISGNAFWDRTEPPVDRDLSDPALLSADTLFTTIERSCPALGTASLLSKEYLFSIFQPGGQNVATDSVWDPRPTNIPVSGHTPDIITMQEALTRLPGADFMFVNLGDVDRTGHVDLTGGVPVPQDILDLTGGLLPNTALLRQIVLRNTDAQIGLFVQALRDAGRWERSVVIVLSDHGMDWSTPVDVVNLQPVLDGVEDGAFFVVQNGGADTVYLRDLARPDAGTLLAEARAAVLAQTGVDEAWYRTANPADPGPETVVPASLHLDTPNAGDLIALAGDGYRFSDPTEFSNPIPGNHGHLTTVHNTFLIGGGAPFVRSGQVIAASVQGPGLLDRLPEQSENVDVAPTVAWLLGLPAPAAGYQGRVLAEAFSVAASPSTCGQLAATPATPAGGGAGQGGSALVPTGGAGPIGAAAVLAAVALVARRRRREPRA